MNIKHIVRLTLYTLFRPFVSEHEYAQKTFGYHSTLHLGNALLAFKTTEGNLQFSVSGW